MRPLYIVVEEAWSISAKANERRLLVKCHGVHDEGDQLYWWGWNDGDPVNRLFVIKLAPPSLPVFVGKGGRPRGRRTRTALPTTTAVEASGAISVIER